MEIEVQTLHIVSVYASVCAVCNSNLSKKPAAQSQLKRGTFQNKRDRLFTQLPITSAGLIGNFTQQRGITAINSAHLFMKSSRLKSTVPPGRCLQCCQHHILSIYPDVTAVALQLPSTVTHTHLALFNCDITLNAPSGVVRHCADCAYLQRNLFLLMSVRYSGKKRQKNTHSMHSRYYTDQQ